MGVYINNITLDEFVKYGGEYAAHLAGIGQADEVPDHGELIDRDKLILNSGMCVSDFGTPDEQWRPDRDWYLCINAQTIIIPAERNEASLCDNCDERNDKGCCVCKYIKERGEE